MKDITVYSTSWCGFCHQLKEWLKEKGLEFEDIDIEADEAAAKEVVEATKQMGVPVTKINDSYVVGFDRPKLEELLKSNNLI
jgi:glutaredoxin-like YruB-family protein